MPVFRKTISAKKIQKIFRDIPQGISQNLRVQLSTRRTSNQWKPVKSISKSGRRNWTELSVSNLNKTPRPAIVHPININKSELDIVIPCAGYSKRLTLLLSTLAAQTFQNFRLTVVGDYNGPHTRIDRLIPTDFKDDKSKMLNTAIFQAKNDFICTLDADAYLPANFLEESLMQIKDSRLYLPVRRDITQECTKALLNGQGTEFPDIQKKSERTTYPPDLPIGFCFFFQRYIWTIKKFRENSGSKYAATDTGFARDYCRIQGSKWIRLNTTAYHLWHPYLSGGACKNRNY